MSGKIGLVHERVHGGAKEIGRAVYSRKLRKGWNDRVEIDKKTGKI